MFYTYLWLREDGTPYYVGKGSGDRAFRKGSPPKDRIIVQEWPSEEDAFTAEILLVAVYGRKDKGTGILRNLTDGGEGFSEGRPVRIKPEEVKTYLLTHDGISVPEAAKVFECAPKYLQGVANKAGLSRMVTWKWVEKEK